MAQRARDIAQAEHLDGCRRTDCLRLVEEKHANLRAVLQEIEASHMANPGPPPPEPLALPADDVTPDAEPGGYQRMATRELKRLASAKALAPKRDIWHARRADLLALLEGRSERLPACAGPKGKKKPTV